MSQQHQTSRVFRNGESQSAWERSYFMMCPGRPAVSMWHASLSRRVWALLACGAVDAGFSRANATFSRARRNISSPSGRTPQELATQAMQVLRRVLCGASGPPGAGKCRAPVAGCCSRQASPCPSSHRTVPLITLRPGLACTRRSVMGNLFGALLGGRAAQQQPPPAAAQGSRPAAAGPPAASPPGIALRGASRAVTDM